MSTTIPRLMLFIGFLTPCVIARGQVPPRQASFLDGQSAVSASPPSGEYIPLDFGDGEMLWDHDSYFEIMPGPPKGWWHRGHVSVDLEALIWWSHGMRLPPLVSTSPPGTPLPAAGVLGPGFAQTLTSSVLFGADREVLDTNAGGRVTLGYWTDDHQTLGIVGNFLALDGGDFEFNASSTGTPILARPFLNVSSGSQDSDVLAIPPTRQGAIHVRGTNNILGSEVYLFENIWMCANQRIDFLYGYRFFRVDEDLQVRDRVDFPDGEQAIPEGTFISSFDLFDTENEFHGGQFGFAWRRRYAVWSLGGHFKLALGSMQQRVRIEGGSTTIVPDPFSQSDSLGGLLALPTNIGEYSRNRFAVIPEISVGGSFWFTPHLKGSMAYDFIYVSRVARPGDQIDLNINPTQIGGGALVGAAKPAFFFDETDYWVQGFSVGLEYRH